MNKKLTKLRIKYGAEGLGLYWYCVEMVAHGVTPKNITFELEHDAEILAHMLKIDQMKCQEMMKFMINQALFEESDEIITCLKLAKRLDDSTSKHPQIKELVSKLEARGLIEPSATGKTPKKSEKVRVIPNNSESLGETPSRLDKNRIDKNRIEKKVKRITYACDRWADWNFPYQPSLEVFDAWLAMRKVNKYTISDNSFKLIGKGLTDAAALGFTVDHCLSLAEAGGWKGLRAAWIQNSEQDQNQSQGKNNDIFNDTSWIDGFDSPAPESNNNFFDDSQARLEKRGGGGLNCLDGRIQTAADDLHD